MNIHFELRERTWNETEHLRHILDGEWVPMLDADGKVLPKIAGKHGVMGEKLDGSHIGADFVRMQPGARFPLHVHDGDHEIYFIEGEGFVHVDGKDILVHTGHVIHIPGEYAHGVWVPENARSPLIFVAMGHPHKHVDATDRMRHPPNHSQ